MRPKPASHAGKELTKGHKAQQISKVDRRDEINRSCEAMLAIEEVLFASEFEQEARAEPNAEPNFSGGIFMFFWKVDDTGTMLFSSWEDPSKPRQCVHAQCTKKQPPKIATRESLRTWEIDSFESLHDCEVSLFSTRT